MDSRRFVCGVGSADLVAERVEPAHTEFGKGICGLGVLGQVDSGEFVFMADTEPEFLVDGGPRTAVPRPDTATVMSTATVCAISWWSPPP